MQFRRLALRLELSASIERSRSGRRVSLLLRASPFANRPAVVIVGVADVDVRQLVLENVGQLVHVHHDLPRFASITPGHRRRIRRPSRVTPPPLDGARELGVASQEADLPQDAGKGPRWEHVRGDLAQRAGMRVRQAGRCEREWYFRPYAGVVRGVARPEPARASMARTAAIRSVTG